MTAKPRVLITGASGTIGHEVLKMLIQSGNYHVTVFEIETKRSLRALSRYKKEIEIIYGDIGSGYALESACINQDFVIHLAALIPPMADEQPELAYKVNALGTENLIRALEKYSPNAFILYSSSISIYGDRVANPNIMITDPLIPSDGDEYAKTKIIAETIIQNSQLDWSIFRLCAIMGEHKISKLMFHQPLNTSFEIATIQDTARAFANALQKPKALSKKIFNLGGGEKCRSTYEVFLKRSFIISGMGKLNFVEKSFADKNFHCGFYQDGSDLENILHFRRDTMDSYFEKVGNKTSPMRRFITSILKRPIKLLLQSKSEPLKAYQSNDIKKIQHYFHE